MRGGAGPCYDGSNEGAFKHREAMMTAPDIIASVKSAVARVCAEERFVDVEEIAREIAGELSAPELTATIADALVEESLRQGLSVKLGTSVRPAIAS